jgi:recombination protein RecT
MTQQVTKSGVSVTDLINRSKPAFEMALGNAKMADHFVRTALTLVRGNPTLAQCDGMTLMAALMQGAQLNLYLGLGLGQAYVIPYWSSKRNCYEAQFQIGYQGLIDLFYRHQLAKELYVETVYSADTFKLKLGTDRYIDHEPATDGDRGNVIGYYAVAKLSSGAQNFYYMTVEDARRWRDHYSKPDKAGKRGVWDTDFDAMAKKTCIKQVLKYMPKSIDMIRILEADETIKRPINSVELGNIDILPNRLEYDQPETEQPEQAPEPVEVKSKSPKLQKQIDAAIELIRSTVPIDGQQDYINLANNCDHEREVDTLVDNVKTNFGGVE